MSAGRWLLAGLLGSIVAVLAYWRRALTRDGATAAAAVGAVVFARGGRPATATLLTFFVSSSWLSRWQQAAKRRRGVLVQAKGGQRDAWQVLANGGFASLWIAAGPRRGGAAFLGALATAAADTWATELGLLAPGPPRLVTSLRPVAAGTSGGITPEGLLASVGGATSVGVAWALGGGRRRLAWTAVASGVVGALIDSILGATIQGLYRCPRCGEMAESARHAGCDAAAELVHGWRWVTNDVVNGLATLAGSVVGAGLGGVGWVPPSAA